MFQPTSRYYNIEDASLAKDGNVVAYKKRRFLPKGEEMPLLQALTVSAGDRLDRISSRVFGDPEQFWQICDANDAMHPLDLTEEPGFMLRIARPWR
ncbi:hypothetical protein NTE_00504 [Candidatus Nitrososphaera evergladensis SR1]|uniref:LysM domain-containing protein n=1 Tax=Candidatus Nitrososphaera evergladensis SR1 TaxID=1459636 RepID=A0A075MN59_9ARCH|nr:hypothetical protein [Candidatus Nitrososphaera evergladensis]AIF82585.1 hypothetical protein NTE_00504 [Candidatus Nitrososphaera evergladensis SR1]